MDSQLDKGCVCACRPAVCCSFGLQRLLVGDMAPTHKQHSDFHTMEPKLNCGLESCRSSTATLRSVLRGEVPAEYSHMATYRMPDIQQGYVRTSAMPFERYVDSPEQIVPSFQAIHSPHQSDHEDFHSSSPVMFPQDEPMDLSCKSTSASDNDSNSSWELSGQPISRSADRCSNTSILRNLLCVGKDQQRDLRSESPGSNVRNFNITGSTRVTLAKKNMFPVSSRVSDWLVKTVQFAKSIPEFLALSQNDKVTLLLNSWTRVLLLFMAENNFEFAVTPLPREGSHDTDLAPSPDEPTMKSVEAIQSFIRKGQNMNPDQKEYSYLRMAVIFNAGYVGLDRPDVVEKLNSLIQQLLQQHVAASRPNDVMHYSRLLLCLPSLYGINSKMFENLFCSHITGNMDMEVLLKEMLQNL